MYETGSRDLGVPGTDSVELLRAVRGTATFSFEGLRADVSEVLDDSV